MEVEHDMGYYRLEGKTPVKMGNDTLEWAKSFGRNNRHIAQTDVGEVFISTAFLGIDHAFRFFPGHEDGPPILFETMIFGGRYDGKMWRCSTWDGAEIQYANAITLVERSQKWWAKILYVLFIRPTQIIVNYMPFKFKLWWWRIT